jgi:hypothetical protein
MEIALKPNVRNKVIISVTTEPELATKEITGIKELDKQEELNALLSIFSKIVLTE